ncbi:MAG: hypothetical protein IJ019_03310 [Alphaproteobacteria bacterium]|nr:hypothetical protein [Alphaproteobacteria bacterium]
MMTEQELEEKLKDKFESVMRKAIKLMNKYGSENELFNFMLIFGFEVANTYTRTPLHIDDNEINHPITLLLYKISKLRTLPINPINNVPASPVSLEDCYKFMEEADNCLESEEKILELAQQLKKEQKND